MCRGSRQHRWHWEAGDGGRGGGGARRRRGPRAEETSEHTRIQGWPCGGGVGEGDWIRGNTTYKSKKHFGIETILITLITTTIHFNEIK